MRSFFLAVIASAALVSSAQAGDGPIAQLDFFQGCWRGEFAGQPGVTDERCFAPMLGGQYVRDTHVVRGRAEPYSGETVYYLDAQAHRLAFTYFAADGSVLRGFADADEHGFTFPPSQFIDANGEALTLRSTWRKDGQDSYVATTEMQQNDEWRPLMQILYARAPDRSPPGH